MPLSTPVRNFFLSRDIFIKTQYVNKGVYCKTYCLDGANKSVISTLIFLQCDMRWFTKKNILRPNDVNIRSHCVQHLLDNGLLPA